MSWTRRLTPHTLAGKFLVFQLGVVGIVLLVAGLVSVRQSTSQFAAGSGERVLGAAENVAGNPLVKRGDSVNPATALAPVAGAVEFSVRGGRGDTARVTRHEVVRPERVHARSRVERQGTSVG